MPTLRLIFFALLLANVGFYAWRLNAGPAEGHEPERLQQQLAPESLILILPEKTRATTAAMAATPAAANTTNAGSTSATAAAPAAEIPTPTSTQTKPATDQTANKKPAETSQAKPVGTPALLCKSFGGFTPDVAKATELAINNSSPHTQVVLIPVKETVSYWVHIPPQKNKAGAEKKLSELKDLGVNDSFIISDKGPTQWAVSLGLFHSKETAENYQQKLSQQGVRSSRIEERGNGGSVRIEVSAPAEALGVLAREIKPLAGAPLSDCKAVTGEIANN